MSENVSSGSGANYARIAELEEQRDVLKEFAERILKDIILDKQDIEYYKRIHLIHRDWARAALDALKSK